MEPRRIGLERSEWEVPATILLLLLGGFILLVGWIAGVVLLWTSSAWTLRDRLIGTFVLPFGAVLPFAIALIRRSGGSGEICSGEGLHQTCVGTAGSASVPATILFVAALAAPFATSFYLWRRSRP